MQQRETSSSSPAQLKWLLLGEFPEMITELLLPFMVFSFPLTFMLSRIKMTCNLPCLSKPLYSALASNFPPASALLQTNPGSVHIRGQKFSPSLWHTHAHTQKPASLLLPSAASRWIYEHQEQKPSASSAATPGGPQAGLAPPDAKMCCHITNGNGIENLSVCLPEFPFPPFPAPTMRG